MQAGQVWKDDALRCSVTGNRLVGPEDGGLQGWVRTIQAVTARTRGHDFAFPLLGVRWGPVFLPTLSAPQRELPGVTLRFPSPLPQGAVCLN